MKKLNTKDNKGITLIALVITIIVLLILATVSIQLVMNSGIIVHAESATNQYVIEAEKERIRLAYSEYQMEKIINPAKTLQVSGEDATTEPVGIYGWKVKYENTGNVYGINTKGEYDEAVTMIIEASEATGLGLDCFMIFEDKYGIKANADAGRTIMPERYVFYNWSKLTDDEIVMIETTYNPTVLSKTGNVYNLSNRLCVLDADGDGNVDLNKDGLIIEQFLSGATEGTISQKTHNILADLCIVDSNTQKTVYEEMIEVCYSSGTSTDFDSNKEFYSQGASFLLQFEAWVGSEQYYTDSGDLTWFQALVLGNDKNAYFWILYTGDDEREPLKYYSTERPNANQ